MDQLKIDNLKSFDDFNASFSERKIIPGDKKEARESVPFSNVTYDFSKMDGELYWEDAELSYTFEIVANSPNQLELYKTNFKNWVMNVFEQSLYDPFLENYHYIATFNKLKIKDDESMLKSTIEVEFVAYPYAIANKTTLYAVNGKANTPTPLSVEVKSSHPIIPTIECDTDVTIVNDTQSITFPKGKHTNAAFKLHGLVNLEVKAIKDFSLKLSFNNEVL